MKLYTEERVMNMILKAFGAKSTTTINDILKQSTPIELPSDEEIKKDKDLIFNTFTTHPSPYQSTASYYFELGAKWMREQILNQNK